MVNLRLNKFDNLKGFAIILIVFWHLRIADVFPLLIMKFVYISALPIFFFVAGYFSKTTPDQPLKNFKRLIIPYIIFTILFKLFSACFTGKVYLNSIFIQTEIGLWFLLVLFFMKILLPIIDKFRFPLLISIICALLAGFIDVSPNLLGLTRFMGYLPIFVLGFYYENYKEKFYSFKPKLYEFYKKHFKFIFCISLIIIVFIINIISHKFMLFKYPYEGNILFEIIKTAIIIIVEMVFVVLLTELMTNDHTFLTKFGKNSMAVYLLHIFFLIINKKVSVLNGVNDMVAIPMTFILVFAVVFIFSRDFFTNCLNKLTNFVAKLIINYSWIIISIELTNKGTVNRNVGEIVKKSNLIFDLIFLLIINSLLIL